MVAQLRCKQAMIAIGSDGIVSCRCIDKTKCPKKVNVGVFTYRCVTVREHATSYRDC